MKNMTYAIVITVVFVFLVSVSISLENKFCQDIENHPNIRLLPTKSCGFLKQANLMNKRIIGGDSVQQGEMPWMVLLTNNEKREFCGGSLISDRYVLTAAHCTDPYKKTPMKIRVRIGDFDTDTKWFNCKNGKCPQHYLVDLIIQHENYKERESYHDISLLRLARSVDYIGDFPKPICLPTTCEMLNLDLVGKHVTIAGWGNLYDGGLDMDQKVRERSTTLQKLRKVVAKQPEDCPSYDLKTSGSVRTLSSQLCAVYQGSKDTKDACQGDSGGPMTYTLEWENKPRVYQVGIVSLGDLCVDNRLLAIYTGRNRMPAIYTKVTSYMPWILKHLSD